MRAYFFGNMYLSSIQQGIQAAHTVVEMYNKYMVQSCNRIDILQYWAVEHKTMILLNAGYSEEIRSLVEFFSDPANPLPWAHFNEGKDALDGALTCVGIILPEEFYEAAKELRTGVTVLADPTADRPVAVLGGENYNKLESDWERALVARLNNYGMAK